MSDTCTISILFIVKLLCFLLTVIFYLLIFFFECVLQFLKRWAVKNKGRRWSAKTVVSKKVTLYAVLSNSITLCMTVLLLFKFLKKHHLPVRQVENRIH